MFLGTILRKHNNEIIDDWVRHLHDSVSRRYDQRPLDELYTTVTKANEANYAVLVNGDYSLINDHIEWITKIRLEGGFSLSEVQHAYELYRTALTPIILAELDGPDLKTTMKRLNECLFYTITRFSNYFQSLHEEQIRSHAEGLQYEVIARTRELAESEAKYRILVEEISDGYFVNQNGKIVFANQAFCDLHGYTPAEMNGMAYTETVAPASLPMVQKLYHRRITGADSKDQYIYLRRHKNGDTIPTENKVKGILFEGSYAVAGVCRDITERIKTEKRIREAERFAYIGKLTTSLAHEIRNPLCAVKMNSQLLLKNTAFKGNDKRRMEIVVNEISRLEGILDEMLDFAKPLRLKLEKRSIARTIDSCLETLDVRIREKDIIIRKSYTKSRTKNLLYDPQKLEQAIINILINSIDAMQSGGTIEITTKVIGKSEQWLAILITDDGPGIPPEDFPYIFDPFFSSKKKGTGLGLANVKKIMEAHGGKATAASNSPIGTELLLTLPITKEVST
jgi:PAS domain S-box-containing protein